MKPFVDQLNVDMSQLLSDLRMPVDLALLQSDWVQGEVCFAFSDALANLPMADGQLPSEIILPILLIDVRGFEDAAFEAVSEHLKNAKGAVGQRTNETLKNSRLATTTFDEDAREFLLAKAVVTHSVSNGWLMIGAHPLAFSYHSTILREGRDSFFEQNKENGNAGALSSNPLFQKVMGQTLDVKHASDLKWFVEPIGFAKILKRLDKRRRKDDWLDVLENEGLDAFVGVGGRISLATDDHELLHRTFVCTTLDSIKKKNMLGLFDFDNQDGNSMSPPIWVPSLANRCLVANWNKQLAFNSVKSLYDAFLEEPGAFERTLDDFKADPDMQWDMEKFVESFERPTLLVNNSVKGQKEGYVLGFKLKPNSEFVIEDLKRAIGPHRTYQVLGYKVLETVSKENEDQEDFPLPGDENVHQREKRFFAFARDVLIVSPTKELISGILKNIGETRLSESEDYIQVHAALGKLIESKNIGIRSFARLGQSLENDYDLFRNGGFKWGGWLLKDVADDQGGVTKKRVPRLDGSLLPKDFQKDIAPSLGLSGWVLENRTDGFSISGCWLKD